MFYTKELPEKCSTCDACHTREYNWNSKICGDLFCGIVDEDLGFTIMSDNYMTYKPDWCPITKTIWDAVDEY